MSGSEEKNGGDTSAQDEKIKTDKRETPFVKKGVFLWFLFGDDVAPAPAAFTTADGIRVNTRINYDTISTDSIYIIYYTEADLFKDRFTLTPFYDWYVAVPK